MDFTRPIETKEIPLVCTLIERGLRDPDVYRATPEQMDSVISGLWSLDNAFKAWIHPYMMGDMSSDNIRVLGSYLLQISEGTLHASDELVNTQNIKETVGFIWPVINAMKGAWNKMDSLGLVVESPIVDESELAGT